MKSTALIAVTHRINDYENIYNICYQNKNQRANITFLISIGILCLCISVMANAQQNNDNSTQELSAEQLEAKQWEKWFEEDFEEKARNVNEGELNFLASPPTDKVIHSITNTITISQSSLDNHWVALRQCHKNLDPVAASEIVYKYKNIRDLRIEHYFGIDKAWIDNQSVQLEGVEKNARLCILADVQILRPVGANTYKLLNGPYFRKFLDGYYPFHVTVVVNYPSNELQLASTNPKPQSGFNVQDDQGTLNMDAWFEGELVLEARFTATSN